MKGTKSLKFRAFAALCCSQIFENPLGSQHFCQTEKGGSIPIKKQKKKNLCGSFGTKNPSRDTNPFILWPEGAGKKAHKILAGKKKKILAGNKNFEWKNPKILAGKTKILAGIKKILAGKNSFNPAEGESWEGNLFAQVGLVQ